MHQDHNKISSDEHSNENPYTSERQQIDAQENDEDNDSDNVSIITPHEQNNDVSENVDRNGLQTEEEETDQTNIDPINEETSKDFCKMPNNNEKIRYRND